MPRDQVFISYARADAEAADALAQALNHVGVLIWMDRTSLAPGENWQQSIVDGLAASKVVAVLISKASLASKFVFREALALAKAGQRIIPILIEPGIAPKLPPDLAL